MDPLISIILPCYNSASTLPWAVASLLAQTYEEWECIFVDDGSTDHPETVLRSFSDPRLRCYRLPKNCGRGAARRFALEQTRGAYIGMLDADDWLYPGKLSSQLDFIRQQPGLALVSTGMAIINANNEMVGVQCRGNNRNVPVLCRTGARPIIRPFIFAPSLIRADAARQTGFDPAFASVEDMDFLMRLLINQQYGVLPALTYAYRESLTERRILLDHRLSWLIHWRYADRYPVSSCVGILSSLAKCAIYKVGFTLGQEEWLKRRRAVDPALEEAREFRAARQTVSRRMGEIFGAAAAGERQAPYARGDLQPYGESPRILHSC